jgi:HEAT repeat protein
VHTLSASSHAAQQGVAHALYADEDLTQSIAALPAAASGLVQFLSSSSPFVQQVAAAALGELSAGGEDFRQQITAVPCAVEGLVQLLGSSSRGVQEAAAWVLFNLADSAEALQQQIAAVPSAVVALVQLLSNRSSERLQEIAAGTLGNLTCGDEAFKQQIADVPGAVEGLVQLLNSSSQDVQDAAAWASSHVIRISSHSAPHISIGPSIGLSAGTESVKNMGRTKVAACEVVIG